MRMLPFYVCQKIWKNIVRFFKELPTKAWHHELFTFIEIIDIQARFIKISMVLQKIWEVHKFFTHRFVSVL